MSYMQVQVKHNEEDITEYLDNFTRQQKICTGIGNLEISFVRTIEEEFEPWDIIELYEEGIKKGTYYVDSVTDSIPDGLITLSCRDGCKKLMDYFISDSYFIDYPSYARTWIEQFLEEAQVNYEFNVSGNGNLLSNNTSLGNSSTYDQIIPLLQMNGWYIYFDADGKAVIGKLQTSAGGSSLSVGKEDILNIKTSKNDKMLRNRVVVWGGIDEDTNILVKAEAVTTTPWNYDGSDLRTSVISNSAIRSYEDAYSIANMALAEFSQITWEKHLECYGGRDVSIGDFVSVSSDVFSGTGLATTVGSTLNKEGFKTVIILDERCPRLFAFFDFGDFVYISTLGEGVWRKPIDGDGWSSYSAGLLDLGVTDLYKNKGILSAVTASGQVYYNIEDSSIWNPIDIQGLTTVMTVSGVAVSGIAYSGAITARAVIQDRITNNLRIAVGSNTNENYVDYSTGIAVLSSGISPRSWVLDFNPNTIAMEGSYPIHLGSFYGYDVLDIENDGVFDYVTVGASGLLGIKIDEAFFGNTEGIQWHPPEVSQTTYTTMETPLVDYDIVVENAQGSFYPDKALCTYDTTLLRAVVGVAQNSDLTKQYIYGKFMEEGQPRVFTESFEVEIPANLRVLAISQDSPHQYNIFSRVTNTTNTFTFGTVRFNEESYTPAATFTVSGDPNNTKVILGEVGVPIYFPSLRTGRIVWGVKIETNGPTSKVYGLSVDMAGSSFSERMILDCGGNGKYPNRVSNNAIISPLTTGGVLIKLTRCEMEVNYLGMVYSAKFRIINFRGPDFVMYEQQPVISDTAELHRWPQDNFAIGIVGPIAGQSATANIGYGYISTPFQNNVHFVRSSYPLRGDYDMSGQARPNKIVDETYSLTPTSISKFGRFWQAGSLFGSTILGIGKDDRYGIYDFFTGNKIKNFIIPSEYTNLGILPHVDSINNHIYFLANLTESNNYYLLDYTPEADFEKAILLSVNETVPDSLGVPLQNAESWLILNASIGSQGTQILYIHLYNLAFIPLVIFSVLKREESDFTLLRSDFKNMRLDDSLGMPLISVSDQLKTTSLMRNYASGYSFTNILTEGPLEEQLVHDFKYTTTGVTPIGSGVASPITTLSGAIGRNFLYATDVGIKTIPMDNSLNLPANQTIFGADSGTPYRLETTNYKFPNQRIFAVTSGEAGNRFFQSDPVISGFSEYTNGLPQTIITRIRVDDRL